MPGDGLAFPVGVGREDQLVGILDRVGNFLDDFLRLTIAVPVHFEVILRFDRPILGGQIAHVPVGCDDLVTAAQVFVDGLGLGSRFNDDDVHLKLSG